MDETMAAAAATIGLTTGMEPDTAALGDEEGVASHRDGPFSSYRANCFDHHTW
jgi:hypothetical protein